MKKLLPPIYPDSNAVKKNPPESFLFKNLQWTWQVDQDDDRRADTVLLEALMEGKGVSTGGAVPVITRSHVKRLIEEGKVRVNAQVIKPSAVLKKGAWIVIDFEVPRPTSLQPEDRPLEILFEDEHLLVINKPPNLTVHPSPTQMDGTLVQILLHHVDHLSQVGGELRAGIVHRIDKDTSGALVISKTDEAHLKLVDIFAKHQIERRYWALCFGAPVMELTSGRGQEKWLKIEGRIGRSVEDRRKMSMNVKTGRNAISYYRCLKTFAVPNKKSFASWIEVKLDTGRTHQVRVHLTSLGHSILGDPVYGVPTEHQPKWTALPNVVKDAVRQLPGQALHARVLGFQHPITQKMLRFEAELPAGFSAVVRALESFSVSQQG